MISHAKIFRHRRMFKTLTGLSTEGFKQMLPSFEEAWEANLDRRDAGRLRLRDRGGGRKGVPGVRRQTRVHPGLFPALPYPSGAGSALRDEPAAGQRVGSPSDPVPLGVSPKLRVRVEHSSAGVKVFRSVRDIYRNFKAGFEDTLIETTCGLHNLRSSFPIEAWLKAA
jgi:hypothetical protein